ncbi:MAG: SWIM zinc finger domain-containing protein [Bifidobacteriaceae bacterium]|nr:SWIM zinc finger domain-containing protein [Bifidobacteriaceae bacterium]
MRTQTVELGSVHHRSHGGAVTWADRAHATVAGQGGVYLVALGADLAEATCTCPWYGRHHGARGPCKHVLAATLARPGAAA